MKSFAESGLTSGPGGQEYNDRYCHFLSNKDFASLSQTTFTGMNHIHSMEYRQIFSYHIYCIFLDSDGQVRLNLISFMYMYVYVVCA